MERRLASPLFLFLLLIVVVISRAGVAGSAAIPKICHDSKILGIAGTAGSVGTVLCL